MLKFLVIFFVLFCNFSKALAQEKNPALIVKTQDSQLFDLQKNRGKKVVIVIFVSWCKFCYQEMSELQKTYEKNDKNLEIIAINFDEMDDEKDFLNFAKKFSFKIAKFSDIVENNFIAKPDALPILYFVNEEGKMVKRF